MWTGWKIASSPDRPDAGEMFSVWVLVVPPCRVFSWGEVVKGERVEEKKASHTHLIHWICKSWEEAGWEGGELTRPSWAAFAPDCLKFQLNVGPSGRSLCDTNPRSFRCHSAQAAPFVKGPLNQIDTIYSISLFIHMYAAPRFDKRLLSRGKK